MTINAYLILMLVLLLIQATLVHLQGDENGNETTITASGESITVTVDYLKTETVENVPDEEPSEKALFDHIQEWASGDVSPLFRPRQNATSTVKVGIRLVLNGILSFREKRNLIDFRATVNVYWRDDFFQWDLDDYHGIDLLIIPSHIVWIPSLVVANSPDNGRSLFDSSRSKVWAWSTGHMQLEFSGILTVKCVLDVRFFPYDYQTCRIAIKGDDGYDKSQLELVLFDADDADIIGNENENDEAIFSTDGWARHPIWSLVNENHDLEEYDESNYAYFDLTLHRRPFFYNVNMLTPSVLIASNILVIYLLAIDEPGKFSICFAMLFAYTMFENMVNNNIPQSSQSVPIFSIYIVCQKCYIAGIVIFGQGIVLYTLSWAKRADKENGSPPQKRFYRFVEIVGKILLVRHIRQYKNAKCNAGNNINDGNSELGAVDKWTYIAMVFNRITLIAYLLAMIITPIVITQYHFTPPVQDETLLELEDDSD